MLPPDFALHVNELTLAIQNARQNGQAYQLTSSFEPLSPGLDLDAEFTRRSPVARSHESRS